MSYRSGPGAAGDRSDIARIRGGAAGLISGTISVAAHGWASGGAAPGGTSLMLLAATSAVIGALVTSIAPLRTRSTGLVAALVGGQLLGHIGMGWDSGHLHHGDAQLTPAMIGAHTAAALAAALVIRGAEFAYRVATAVLTQVVRVLGNPQPADDLAPLRTTHTDRVILRVFAADTARTRAPPLAACF